VDVSINAMEAIIVEARVGLEKSAGWAGLRQSNMHTFVGWNRCTSSRMVYGGQHVCRRSGLYSQHPERRQPRLSSSCHSSGQKLMAS